MRHIKVTILLVYVFCLGLKGQIMLPTYSVFNPQSAAMMNSIPSPLQGGLVYNTTDECYYYYKASTSSWESLCNTGNGIIDNIYTDDGTLDSDRLVTVGDKDFVFNKISNTDPSEGTLTLNRNYQGVSSRRVPSLVLTNDSNFPSPQGLQNTTTLSFRTNDRGYISWENAAGLERWIIGRNAGNDFPMFESASSSHRVYLETMSNGGDTDFKSVGSGYIYMNRLSSTEPNTSTNGAQIWGDFRVNEPIVGGLERLLLRSDGTIELFNHTANPPGPSTLGYGICVVSGVYKKWDGTSWVNL